MSIPKLWALKKDEAKGPENAGGGVYRKGFVYSHVLTTYYNWKEKKLLKSKLDDMDALIAEHAEAIAQKLVTNDKFNEELAKYVAKSMMVGVDTNDPEKVPNAAFIHALAEKITANESAITTLNSEQSKVSENIGKYLANVKYFGADNTIETIKSYMKTLTESKLILATINYNSSASLDKNTNPMIMSSVVCIQFARTGVIGIIDTISSDWKKVTLA